MREDRRGRGRGTWFCRDSGLLFASWKSSFEREVFYGANLYASERTRPMSIRKPSLLVKDKSSSNSETGNFASSFFHGKMIMSGYEPLDWPVIAFAAMPELTCRFLRLCLFAPRCPDVVRNLRDNCAPFALCASSCVREPGVAATNDFIIAMWLAGLCWTSICQMLRQIFRQKRLNRFDTQFHVATCVSNAL